MKKVIITFLVLFLSQFELTQTFAGSDGSLDISKKTNKNIGEVKDCFEGLNRGVFAFNQGLDKVFFKPIAKGYRILPQPIRSGTSNVLSNLSNVVTIPNNVLQGELKEWNG